MVSLDLTFQPLSGVAPESVTRPVVTPSGGPWCNLKAEMAQTSQSGDMVDLHRGGSKERGSVDIRERRGRFAVAEGAEHDVIYCGPERSGLSRVDRTSAGLIHIVIVNPVQPSSLVLRDLGELHWPTWSLDPVDHGVTLKAEMAQTSQPGEMVGVVIEDGAVVRDSVDIRESWERLDAAVDAIHDVIYGGPEGLGLPQVDVPPTHSYSEPPPSVQPRLT